MNCEPTAINSKWNSIWLYRSYVINVHATISSDGKKEWRKFFSSNTKTAISFVWQPKQHKHNTMNSSLSEHQYAIWQPFGRQFFILLCLSMCNERGIGNVLESKMMLFFYQIKSHEFSTSSEIAPIILTNTFSASLLGGNLLSSRVNCSKWSQQSTIYLNYVRGKLILFLDFEKVQILPKLPKNMKRQCMKMIDCNVSYWVLTYKITTICTSAPTAYLYVMPTQTFIH